MGAWKTAVAAVTLLSLWVGGLTCSQSVVAADRKRAATVSAPAAARDWAAVLDPAEVSADAALLMDWASGTVLFEKNPHRPMHPASITKMMTAIVALEDGYLGDVVTVSRYAAETPGSSMGLAEGGRYLLEDLLAGLMIVSGNDAAIAIAEHIAGSEQAFVQRMNEKALKLGAVNTTFLNPHGISEPGHLSTAYDLALIARHGLSIPYFSRLVGTREKDAWRLDRMWELPLANTNRLLWGFQGADGVKTGTTSAAGACLCASATRNGFRVIAVVLHADSRWRDSELLLEHAFSNYEPAQSFKRGDVLARVEVVGGMKRSVNAVLDSDLVGVVRKGEDSTLRIEVEAEKRVRAPVDKWAQLGWARLWTKDRLVAVAGLCAAERVERRTLLRSVAGAYAPALMILSRAGLG
ncbi:MAG: D-alanyl-D-alanine carboxypeptidase [Firmicutes bacterium]|jgi:D-alanyl-D-alanine carboxypeptidase (penicillin-binding protein 5/6)|nr:D-alanyl-D-alanine carboxypeptidase [Bacillota bacterium]